MFQKFFSDSLISRFIKNLLSKETIPLLDCVSIGDFLIEGCFYIYKEFVIKCVESGKLFISTVEEGNLYPSETLYPSAILFSGKITSPARFKVVSYYNDTTAQMFSYSYKSNVRWYDSETHKHLGNYLRYLRDCKQIDLMPYYNCFNSYELSDVYLKGPEQQCPSTKLYPSKSLYPSTMYRADSSNTYVIGHDDRYRVIAVPIKFGKTYTIALDCSGLVQFRCIIYGHSGMTKIPKTSNQYYSDYLSHSYASKTCTHFDRPFLYSIDTDNKLLYERQRDLYLIIQIPVSTNSSIVVLEGNYTNVGALKTNSESVRIQSLFKNISLLKMNTKENYAFSDRLIEYLLDNVITSKDEFSTNIKKVQQSLYIMDDKYRSLVDNNQVSYGVWDIHIQSSIFRIIEKYQDQIYFQDQDGFINKDIEDLLLRVGKEYRR